jgi:hypothetical protein
VRRKFGAGRGLVLIAVAFTLVAKAIWVRLGSVSTIEICNVRARTTTRSTGSQAALRGALLVLC